MRVRHIHTHTQETNEVSRVREGREEGLDRGSKKGGNRRIIKGQRTRSIKGGDKNPEGSRKMSRFDRDRPLANGCARISQVSRA